MRVARCGSQTRAPGLVAALRRVGDNVPPFHAVRTVIFGMRWLDTALAFVCTLTRPTLLVRLRESCVKPQYSTVQERACLFQVDTDGHRGFGGGAVERQFADEGE